MDDIAEIVRNYRNKAKWTQEQLALILGIDQTMVSKIETGMSDPGKKVAIKLALLTKQPLEIFIR